MKRSVRKKQLDFSYMQITEETFYSLKKEGYLGMPESSLPISREKKPGTSVTARSSLNYSATLSPPPIRPMVEKHPFYEKQKPAIKVQKRIEECA